jgi:MFS superfamily sulfate permease-like transporter
MQSTFETPSSGWTSYWDLWIAIASFGILFLLKKVIISLVWKTMYDNCKEKDNEELRI